MDKIESEEFEADHYQISKYYNPNTNETAPNYIVVIGSSAGGVEALSKLLDTIPKSSGNAYILIQHMSPDFKTMLPEILTRRTPHTISIAEDGELIQRDSFYLTPPDKLMTIFHGRLILENRLESHTHNFNPIDYFLQSLSKVNGPSSIAIILSGTGSDGSKGIQELKKKSGYIIVQSPATAKFDGMPINAIATKVVNAVVDLENIAKQLIHYSEEAKVPASHLNELQESKKDLSREKTLICLRNSFNVDFSFYKDELIDRRILRRTKIVNCKNIDEYYNYIVEDKAELSNLYDDLLLGVTSFNRHPKSLLLLKETIFPQIIENLCSKEAMRVWIVGCSTGEEAYTIAFLINDFLKETKSELDFKIFATDIDDKSLKIASRAFYPEEKKLELPEDWQKKYFRLEDGRAFISPRIRERVIFANHDITEDAPFPSIDLVVCRNLLIYLKSVIKHQVYTAFKFSLKNNGFLHIGPSDSLQKESLSGWKTIHPSAKLYQCTEVSKTFNLKPRPLISAPPLLKQNADGLSQKKIQELEEKNALYNELVNDHSPPTVIFSEQNVIEYYIGNVKEYLSPLTGKASHRLEDALPGEVYAIIMRLKNQVISGDSSCAEYFSEFGENEVQKKDLRIEVAGLDINDKKYFIAKFILQKTSTNPNQSTNEADQIEVSELREKLKDTKKQLLSTRTEMAIIIGQLEASNEELKTSNEELQSSGEELQSANEELQAVNEELYTVNAECQARIMELSEMSSDLQNIYDASNIGTIFVDKNLRIRKFNSVSQKIFNLLLDDTGRPLSHFSSSTSSKIDIEQKVKTILKKVTVFQSEIKMKNGITYLMRISPYRTDNLDIKGAILIFIEVTSLKKVQTQLLQTQSDLDLIAKETSEFVLNIDLKGKISQANDSFCQFFNISQDAIKSDKKNFIDYVYEDSKDDVKKLFESIKNRTVSSKEFKCFHMNAEGGISEAKWHWNIGFNKSGKVSQVICIGKIFNGH